MLTVLLLTVAFSSFYSFPSVSSGHFNVTTVDHSDQMVKYLVDLSVTPLKTHPNEFKLDLRPIYARFFPKGYQQVLVEEEKSDSRAMLISWITSTFHHRVSIELRLITDQTPTGLLEVSIDDCSNVSTTAVSCPSLLSWSNSHRSLINITSLFRYTWQYPLHIVVKLSPTDSQAGLKVSSIAVHLEIIAAECTKRISAEETLCISEPHCRQECGHYAFVQTASKDSLIAAIVSPYYSHTGDGCQLQFKYRIRGVAPSEIVVAVQPLLDSDRVGTGTLAGQIHPKSAIVSKWTNYTVNIGKMLKPMRIKIEAEVVRGQNLQMNLTADVMIDDIELTNCGEILYQPDKCAKNSTEVYRCSSSKLCIPLDEVCDLFPNCFGGEDEDLALHNCSQVPLGARCTFEEGMCGWVSEPASFRWVRVNVSNGQLLSEPNGHTDSRLVFDHTYKNHSGHFMYAELGEGIRMETARLVSPKFPPTPKNLYEEGSPLYNQCKLRFFYNHLGRTWHSVTLWQYTDTGRTKLWAHENEMSSNSEDMDPWDWERVSLVIPYTDSDYNLTFAAIRMALYKGNFGIDDFSITPQCFSGDMSLRDHTKVYNFSTCGATGIYGPTQKLCTAAYNKTSAKVIIDRGVRPGLQKWKVPMTGEYKIVAGGASGGVIDNRSGDVHNFGAEVTGVVQLQKDSHLLLAVGQMGESPCEYRRPFKRDAAEKYRTLATLCSPGLKTATSPLPISLESLPGAGGGGGSFVVYLTRGAEELLISAAGGGGLFAGGNNDEHSAGRQMNISVVVKDSKPHEKGPAGNGGSFSLQAEDNMTGGSWAEHLRGGLCGSEAFWDFSGGFGGGGAACGPGGGGGGGHTGGQGGNFTSGLGGRSYSIAPRSPIMREAQFGHGYILIYPCLLQCPTASVCRFKADSQVCVCTTGQIVNEKRGEKCPQDASANNAIQSSFLPSKDYLMAIIICIVLLLVAFMFVIVYVVCHYRNARHKYLQKEATNNELPMRNFPGSNFHTEYNPNYDFSCNLKELNEIPRTCVTLIKALGQGAFGEVFEGVLNNVADELNNLPIAVKSLPEFATEQAQLDFCMEALIMSKFHHPNIVRFIGVCFDKMPRLIILELLAGGDLKTFLRENRPKIDNPSRLTMTDLLQMACDVAKGCQYLEDNHFIHRDIAARNCLLTSKDPGRIVKIADFGMARDIYRADYYRKGGKAMLPVKWMPPEAFLDGIFTSKTDVWSYGVLLWEIFSLGYMPYPGRGNQEVMQLVTAGGRLEPPHGCPTQVYQIMTQCWHTIAEERPRFATIIERLGYCIQDPDICDAPLMVFQRQQTVEREISSSNRTSLSDVQPVAKPTNIHTPEPLPTKGSGVTSCFYPPYNPRSQDYLLPLGSPKQSAGSTSDCPSDLLLVPSRSTATTSLGTPTPSFGGILGSNMIPLQTGDLDDDVFSPLNAQKLFDSHQQPPCEPHVVLRKNLND